MKKIFLIILITITLIPAFSKAQEYTLLEPLPCIEYEGSKCASGKLQANIDIKDYILYMYKFSIALAVFLAIVMIIWGGFLYITSETPFKIEDGKTKIQNAMIGLGMVLVSYLILLTIDPRLVNIDTNIPAIRYDKKELDGVSKFHEQLLLAGLYEINMENQSRMTENNKKIQTLDTRKKELERIVSKGDEGEISMRSEGITEEDIEKAKIEIQKIEGDINNLKIENGTIVLESSGVDGFMKTVAYIYDPEKTDAATKIQDFKNSNGYLYSTEIAKLRKINSNFEQIQKLEKQRDFYASQIDEEVELKKNIASRKSSYLNSKLTEYKTKLEKASDYAKSTGLSTESYSIIIKNRIDNIESSLKKP